MNNMLLQG